MPVSPARSAAYSILFQIERSQRHADDLLAGAQFARLAEPDRRLATELVMETLRWRGSLDHDIASLTGRGIESFDLEVLIALRLGVLQLRHLGGIAPHAAVHESVELAKAARKRSAAGLVNAALRRCPGKIGEGSAEYLDAARRSTPSWMYERWRRILGNSEADAIVLANQRVPAPCLRPAAMSGAASDAREALRLDLEKEGIRAVPAKYARRALRVESGSAAASAAFRSGQAVIQDEASQLVAELVGARPGERILDACAAPGMKATFIAGSMGQGTLAACDLSLRRMRTFARLARKAWPDGVQLLKVVIDAGQPLPFAARPLFDRALVDAPCSGTGTLARNPEIKWRLRETDLARLAARQQRILNHCLAILKPGGRLVYSTCSLEPDENEAVVATALQSHPGFRTRTAKELRSEFPAFAGLFGEDGAFRTRPGTDGMDGFYAAVFEAA